MSARRQALRDAATPSALDLLTRLFALTPFERQVLLLCLAPVMEPDFERLIGYIQNDLRRSHPTPHLAQALFGDGRPAAAASFAPSAPLRALCLLSMPPGEEFQGPASCRPLFWP